MAASEAQDWTRSASSATAHPAAVDLGSQTITIHVSHKVRRPTRCAWFVLD
jgi:hypothetical protein